MCFSSLATVKIAVLLFYKRIFTTKRFRLAASVMMGVITVWWIASLVVGPVADLCGNITT
jgi:hypothetical protein